MDTEPIDVTDILAQPAEFARKLENLRAQVDQRDAELALLRGQIDAERVRANANASIAAHLSEKMSAADADGFFDEIIVRVTKERDAAAANFLHASHQWQVAEDALAAAERRAAEAERKFAHMEYLQRDSDTERADMAEARAAELERRLAAALAYEWEKFTDPWRGKKLRASLSATPQNKTGPALNRPGDVGVTSAINGRDDYTPSAPKESE